GAVSFRIVGPAGPGDNLFTWDSGYGNGAEVGTKPLLRIVALAPTPRATPTRELAAAPDDTPTASPTATYVIITSTPAPENLLTVVPIAASSTALAETMGSPTPLPANWVTPVIVTSTPTPENEATATFSAAIATAWVTLYGTPSPLPENVWTATPEPTATPGPPPAEPAAPPPAPDNPPPVVVVPDSPPPVVIVPEPSAPPATETPISTPTELPLIVPVEQLPPTATEVAVPTTTPVPAVLPAELRGKILFLSDRTGGTDVFVMNPDGTGVGLLTEQWPYDRARELDSFSPDRGQRLFVQPAGNYFEIWVQNTADGWTYRLIGGSRVTYDPAWSPDSIHVAFVSQESGNDEIYVLDKDTAEERRLTHNQWEWDKHPSWSPDGTKIVVWSNRDTSRSQIWVMNADGSEPRNLSNNQFNDWDPVWVK
ncbi:MAG TPA: hypothetical protein VER55_04275, partial [Ardenticatenaceae bacterium]|nr:hypothetical protein [Ardenticatenaceae bacterium]